MLLYTLPGSAGGISKLSPGIVAALVTCHAACQRDLLSAICCLAGGPICVRSRDCAWVGRLALVFAMYSIS